MPTRYIAARDGTRLAVYEQGNPDGPTVVLVHGWPDSHVLWDGVVASLAGKYRIVRYDSRGSGGSGVPNDVAAYTVATLADDFESVATTICPGTRVHAVGHDWGAATLWEYVTRPEASAVVASYTSISGPDPGHLSRYLRDGLSRPYRPRRFAHALAQAAHFSYMVGFSMPVLMPAAMRTFLARLINRYLITPGIPPARQFQGESFVADATNGLRIYRANFLPALTRPARDRPVEIPVQLLVNTRDKFVRPYVYDDTPRWVSRLWRRDIQAGHWSPMSHPDAVAGAVDELVGHLEGGRPGRALLRAQVGRTRKEFGDMLVAVTGAGSGIGRATACAFAAAGAELVVSDIDGAAAAAPGARRACIGRHRALHTAPAWLAVLSCGAIHATAASTHLQLWRLARNAARGRVRAPPRRSRSSHCGACSARPHATTRASCPPRRRAPEAARAPPARDHYKWAF
jgi:pimeloyl-ACP methyl ester carboxylesterase